MSTLRASLVFSLSTFFLLILSSSCLPLDLHRRSSDSRVAIAAELATGLNIFQQIAVSMIALNLNTLASQPTKFIFRLMSRSQVLLRSFSTSILKIMSQVKKFSAMPW